MGEYIAKNGWLAQIFTTHSIISRTDISSKYVSNGYEISRLDTVN